MTARQVGPGSVLGAVVLGVLAGERVGPSDARIAVVVAFVAGGGAVVCVATARSGPGLALCCMAATFGGLAGMARALDGQVHSPLATAVAQRDGAVVDATLTGDPDATRFSSRVLARVDRARLDSGGMVGGGRTVVVDASGDAAPRLGVLRAGDRVRLRGYFRPLDRFEAHERWRHAVGGFAADDLLAAASPGSSLMRLANWVRARVLAGHRGVPEPQRALLAGFLLGDTADLPEPVVRDFRAAGLSHLVAVSGQNVAFVLALTGPVLHRGPRGFRWLAGLAVLVVFLAMTRFEPSVLRASAMAACSMTALAVGRPTAGLRALALAVTALVLADPFLVHSIGFLLSCAASLGIAVLAPAIADRLPGPRPLAAAAGVTVGAQVAVAPVLIVVFDGVPLVSVPANLAVAPLAGPLTMLGIVGGVVGGLLGGVAGAVLSFPASVCASGVLLVARWGGAAPLTLDGPALVLAVVSAGCAVFAVHRTGRATWRRARARSPRSRLAVPPR